MGQTFWTVDTNYSCALKVLVLKKRTVCGADTLLSHLALTRGGPVYFCYTQACLSGQSLDV